MSLIDTAPAPGGFTLHAYEIVNPPTGASDVIITVDAPVEITYLISSYNGVDQADPIGAIAEATGSGANGSVAVASAVGDLVLDVFDVEQTSTVGADQTEEGSDLGGGDEFSGSREAGAASVTMSWTHVAANWGILAFSLNASGVAPSDPSFRVANLRPNAFAPGLAR
jgi:hypothetical protein